MLSALPPYIDVTSCPDEFIINISQVSHDYC